MYKNIKRVCFALQCKSATSISAGGERGHEGGQSPGNEGNHDGCLMAFQLTPPVTTQKSSTANRQCEDIQNVT